MVAETRGGCCDFEREVGGGSNCGTVRRGGLAVRWTAAVGGLHGKSGVVRNWWADLERLTGREKLSFLRGAFHTLRRSPQKLVVLASLGCGTGYLRSFCVF